MTWRNVKVLTVLVCCLFSCSDRKDRTQPELETVRVNDSGQKTLALVYNSTDGGNTWTPFDHGIPHDATVSSFLVIREGIMASTDFHGIYFVSKHEKTWRRVDVDLPENIDINAIAMSGESFIIGTYSHGIWTSKNNGRNWHAASMQIENTHIRCLLSNGEVLFAGADNGIHASTDHGNTWKHVWKGVQVNGFTEVNDKVFAALMNGAIATNDRGTSWTRVYEGHTLHDISSDGTTLYAMTLGGGLKKSGDAGITWENSNDGLGTFNLYTFEVEEVNTTIFAAQWYGIYASNDRGKTWSLIRNGLPDSTAFYTLEKTQNGLIAGIGQRKK